MSTVSKVLESILNSKLLKYLEKQNLLSDSQYGFRGRRSTADLLAFLTHKWHESLEGHGESLIVGLDISKAFDRVWHESLLNKMSSFGLAPCLIKWFRSYLYNRSIRTVVDSTLSEPREINAGVPQGAVLAPTLFLMFIDQLLSTTTSGHVNSYADDTTLHYSSGFTSEKHSSRMINHSRIDSAISATGDLISISLWGASNLVKFNELKTQCMLVSNKRDDYLPFVQFNGATMENSTTINLLGLPITDNLNWSEYVKILAKKASAKLSFLYRSQHIFTQSQLLSLYKATARPHMEYCSHIWAGTGCTFLGLLDSVQRKAINLIGDCAGTRELHSLAHRRKVASLSLFYRYYNKQCSDELQSIVPPTKKV